MPVLKVIFHHLHKTDPPLKVQLSHTLQTHQILMLPANNSSVDTVHYPRSQASPKIFGHMTYETYDQIPGEGPETVQWKDVTE